MFNVALYRFSVMLFSIKFQNPCMKFFLMCQEVLEGLNMNNRQWNWRMRIKKWAEPLHASDSAGCLSLHFVQGYSHLATMGTLDSFSVKPNYWQIKNFKNNRASGIATPGMINLSASKILTPQSFKVKRMMNIQ